MSISRKDYEKAKRLEEEILQLEGDMDRIAGYDTRCKGNIFYVTLDSGALETFRFSPNVVNEVVTALYDICQKRYQQSRAEFDKMVIPEE